MGSSGYGKNFDLMQLIVNVLEFALSPVPTILLSCYSKTHHKSQHERQLDPTEIVAVPYDLERLSVYVASVIVYLILIRHPVEDWPRTLGQWLQLTAVCFALFVLCGASPYEKQAHTVLAAAYFAALCWCEPPVFETLQTVNLQSWSLLQEFQQRFHRCGRRHRHNLHSLAQQRQSLLQSIVLHACIACTIPLQILLLYDRGWQWQRWPIPVVLGSTIGWIGSTIVGTLAITSGKADRFTDTKKMDADVSS